MAGNEHEAKIFIKIDTTSPVIEHEPVLETKEGREIILTVEVTDEHSGVDFVNIYYKSRDNQDYKVLPTSLSDGIYTATIPAEDVTTGLEYYIEAVDKSSPWNFAYYGGNRGIDIRPDTANDIDIDIIEEKGSDKGESGSSIMCISLFILVAAVIMFILWLKYIRDREDFAEPEQMYEEEDIIEPEEPEIEVKAPSPGTKPVTFKKPKDTKKKSYFEEPPEKVAHPSEFIGEKTAMIKFNCSHCNKKSIVQVSKDYHSVICPHCEQETLIG
jgi:hypothetical protein